MFEGGRAKIKIKTIRLVPSSFVELLAIGDKINFS